MLNMNNIIYELQKQAILDNNVGWREKQEFLLPRVENSKAYDNCH